MISSFKKLLVITNERVGIRFYVLSLLSLLAVIVEMFGISLVIPLFDLITENNSISSRFSGIFQSFFSFFKLTISYETILTFIVVAFVIKALLMFSITLFTHVIRTNISKELRIDLLKLIENAQFLYHTKGRSGKNTNVLTLEADRYTSTVSNFVEVCVSLISFFIFLFFASSISFEIVFFILILFASTSIIFLPIISKTKDYSILNTDHFSRTQSSLFELINNFIYLKSTNLTSNLIVNIQERIEALRKISIRLNIFSSVITFTKEPLGVTFFSLIIYNFVVKEGQSFGEIVILAFIVYRITQKLIDLQNFLKRVNDSIGGVFEIENSLKDLKNMQEENLGKKNADFFKSLF